MSLPENWTQLVDHSKEAIQYHESWIIVRICERDDGKYIQPVCYDDVPEGAKCYPYLLLCKPTHRSIWGKSAFKNGFPDEGAVFKGIFGCYKVVHVFKNKKELEEYYDE